MTADDFRKEREQLISKDLKSIEDLVDHVFKLGCESGYQQHSKDFVENEEKAYQKGLKDAWNAARHIALYSYGGLSISYDKLSDIFGYNDPYSIFKDLSASEAIEKIRDYESKKKVEYYFGRVRCTKCGEDWTLLGRPTYCPNCGARVTNK